MNTSDFKEGQTYVCTKSNEEYWTEGKEYKVNLTTYGIPALPDNNGNNWSATTLNLDDNQFKLKEKSHPCELDLNKLTLEELAEYLRLATTLEGAEYLMKDFIERMSK